MDSVHDDVSALKPKEENRVGFCYVELVMLLTWNQEDVCSDIFLRGYPVKITVSRDYNEYEMLNPCSDRCDH